MARRSGLRHVVARHLPTINGGVSTRNGEAMFRPARLVCRAEGVVRVRVQPGECHGFSTKPLCRLCRIEIEAGRFEPAILWRLLAWGPGEDLVVGDPSNPKPTKSGRRLMPYERDITLGRHDDHSLYPNESMRSRS